MQAEATAPTRRVSKSEICSRHMHSYFTQEKKERKKKEDDSIQEIHPYVRHSAL